jgi:hypothetical protein
VRPQVAVPKAARERGEVAEGLEHGHDPGIAEAQGRDPLPGLDSGLL